MNPRTHLLHPQSASFEAWLPPWSFLLPPSPRWSLLILYNFSCVIHHWLARVTSYPSMYICFVFPGSRGLVHTSLCLKAWHLCSRALHRDHSWFPGQGAIHSLSCHRPKPRVRFHSSSFPGLRSHPKGLCTSGLPHQEMERWMVEEEGCHSSDLTD